MFCSWNCVNRTIQLFMNCVEFISHLFLELTLNPPEGIVAGPISEDNFFEWEALIQGPEGTCFEGGVFPARLVFPPDYPLSPPKMKFTCEMFHPNSKFNHIRKFWTIPLKRLVFAFSFCRWPSVYINSTCTRRWSNGLWAVSGTLEPCTKCGENFVECSFDVGRTKRWIGSKCWCSDYVARQTWSIQ